MTKAPIRCLHTEVWPTERFVPHPRNPNTHPESQLVILADIIRSNGWRNPIVVSRQTGYVIKGHGRLAAAKLGGLVECPVELQNYDSELDEVADMVADNRIAELAESDPFTLHGLLTELKTDPDFAILSTGFTDEDLAQLEDELAAPSDELSDGINVPARTTRTRGLSDTTFRCGPILISIERETYLRWLEGVRQQVGFSKASIHAEIRRRLAI